MGWLNSTPDKSKQTRLQALGAGSQFANMPPCDNQELVAVFHDIGLANMTTSIQSLTFSDIAGFKSATGLDLTYHESVAIKKMSDKFVIWLHKGKEHSCNAPYYKDKRDKKAMRAEVMDKFKALARKRK